MVNIPTIEDLRTRYPEFNLVPDARVTVFIEDATRSVDDTWIEDDQPLAILALACHYMSLQGEPALSSNIAAGGDGSAGANQNGRFLKSREVGDVKNEWAESETSKASGTMSKTSSEAGYRSTVYGSVFYRLMKLNHAGMRVV